MRNNTAASLNNMGALYNLNITLMGTGTLEGAFEAILREALHTLKAPAGSIALHDPNTNTMTLNAHKGFPKRLSKITRWAILPGGMTWHILKRSSPTIIHDTQACPFIHNTLMIESGIRSLIAVPFRANGKKEGILYIDDYAVRRWMTRDVDFLILIGLQAAVAVDKFSRIGAASKDRTVLRYLPSNANDIVVNAGSVSRIAEFNKDLMEKNRLEQELETRNRELQELNEKLETKIMARTVELREANRKLERSNALQSKFIATMSHELRTPLCAILGFSEFLRDDALHPLTERQKRFAGDIYNSGNHLLQLINNILDLAKTESGKATLFYEKVSVPQAVSEVISIVRSLVDQKNLNVLVQIAEDVPEILADRMKFKQILCNLLSNAVKFSHAGNNIRIAAETLRYIRKTDAAPRGFRLFGRDFLRLSVMDTGIGIKPDDQDRIFEEFEQVDNLLSRHHKGTGLGLSVTRRLVELHGGEIRVESEEGKGSIFIVDLPLTNPVDEASRILDRSHLNVCPAPQENGEIKRSKNVSTSVIPANLDHFTEHTNANGMN